MDPQTTTAGVLNPGSPNRLLMLFLAVIQGMLFFSVIMGVSVGLVIVNARLNPDIPWFPLPVLALAAFATAWAARRWDVGLPGRPITRPGLTWSLALALTLFGLCLCVLQGAAFGMVRAAETHGDISNPAFQLAYGVALGLLSAILAEVTFRGILQTRFASVLSPWAALLLVAAINTSAHRWGPALEAQWAAYFVALAAWGYLRAVTGSLVPPLVAHAVTNIVLCTTLWFTGPLDQGNLPAAANGNGVAVVAGLAAVSLLASIVLGRRLSAANART